MTESLNNRAKQLLKLLVENYIQEGQPVSSRILAQKKSIALSSATVRNVMAELEEQGYLASPHTSAGRVPTAKAYRIFVDGLLMSDSIPTSAYAMFQKALDPQQNSASLVTSASNILSQVSQLAGLVTLPKQEHFILRHLEFLPLSNSRILAILVLNEQEVQNRIIHTNREYSASELEQAANYLNETFAGKDIADIRANIIAAMEQEKQRLSDLMQSAIDMAKGIFASDKTKEDYVLAGEHHLLNLAVEDDMQSLQELFNTFASKQDLLRLFDQCLQAEGVKIFIGDESGYDVLHGCSLVTAPYSVDNAVVGVLGVIGPMRMQYDKAISIVDVTAKLLSTALEAK